MGLAIQSLGIGPLGALLLFIALLMEAVARLTPTRPMETDVPQNGYIGVLPISVVTIAALDP